VTRFGVLLDACVLVPISLTDTLLHLADNGLFQPLWSEAILLETVDALCEIYPDKSPHGFEARIASMTRAFPHACVVGWEQLEVGLAVTWPDPGDAHVVAAAILGRAELIVTSNLKDFPYDLLEPLGLHAVSPDSFLMDILDFDPELTFASITSQAAETRRPQLSALDVVKSLEQTVPKFARAVRLLIT
jgi:hypothetical protein